MTTAKEVLDALHGPTAQDWWMASSYGVKRWPAAAVREIIRLAREASQEDQRYCAIYCLGPIHQLATASALLAIYEDPTQPARLRGKAAEHLAYQAPRHSRERRRWTAAFHAGLNDRQPEVRFWSLFGLSHFPDPSARPRILEMAATDRTLGDMGSLVATEAKLVLASWAWDKLPISSRLDPGPYTRPAQLPGSTPDAFLRRAIKLAAANVRDGLGGPFGAVVVRGKTLIAEGVNRVTLFTDPTAHAEIVAIREACRLEQTHDLSGCDIYCSCEPNPMCLGAIYWARLRRIYYAASRDDAARAGFNDIAMYAEVSKPIAEREIPTRNLLRRNGRAPFAAWKRSTAKIPY